MNNTRNILILLVASLAVLFLELPLQAAPTSYADAILADSPYAYYRLGESSGTVAADSSGNGRTGSFVNSPTLGVTGFNDGDTGTTFNGTNQSVGLTNNNSFGASLGSCTMEFLLHTTESTLKILSGSTNAGGTTAFNLQLNPSQTGGTGSNGVRFFLRSEEGQQFGAQFTNATLFSGEYVQLAFSFNASAATNADRLQAYVNGVSQTLSGYGSATITGSSTFTNFGFNTSIAAQNNRSNTPSDFAAVTIDEASYFTTPLSASSILAHYNAISVPEPASIAYSVTILLLGAMMWLRKSRRQ